MPKHPFFKAGILAVAASLALPALAQTEIQWWHSMGGELGNWVSDLAEGFNDSQSDYKVVPTYKGSYTESMTAAIAAFRAGNQPDILQVFEVGTATMMYSKGAIKPVAEVMELAGEPFAADTFIPAVASYYTAPDGQMLSFPFNSSTVVLFYNKDAFKEAGLDPEQAPATWPDVQEAASKLKESGSKCPFTTSWMSWTQLENFSAWHNTLYASEGNGFDGLGARLEINSPLHVRHFENLEQMSKDGEFVYKGREGKPDASLISGECAMAINSSSVYGDLKANAKFDFGVGTLPYYPDVEGAPQNTIIGGASLWALSGKSDAVYTGMGKFFAYLASPEVAAAGHQRTGYLPITNAAYELTRESGFYDENPGSDIPVKQMILKAPTDKSRGIRLGNMVQIRTLINEETENIWAGKKNAQQALDSAVKRANDQLSRFEKANSK